MTKSLTCQKKTSSIVTKSPMNISEHLIQLLILHMKIARGAYDWWFLSSWKQCPSNQTLKFIEINRVLRLECILQMNALLNLYNDKHNTIGASYLTCTKNIASAQIYIGLEKQFIYQRLPQCLAITQCKARSFEFCKTETFSVQWLVYFRAVKRNHCS